MEISREELAQRYSKMDDDGLVEIYLEGDLTQVAQEAIEAEMTLRGLPLDPESLVSERQEALPRSPTMEQTAHSAATGIFSGLVNLVVFVVVIGVINLFIFGFGAYIAPFIWSSEIDRACQEEGYWYGSETDNRREIECTRWWAL